MQPDILNPSKGVIAPEEAAAIAYLRSPQAIRERCGQLFSLACQDQLQHFRCQLSQLDQVADYVIQVTKEEYPDLQIPFHSRWRHFEGGKSRLTFLNQALATLTPVEKAKAKFDLAIISVLLDAGAGSDWQYHESETGQTLRRSEGLAIASFHLFCQGAFSSNPNFLYQADATGLQNLTEITLTEGFQVSSSNPLVGMQGRLELLQKLGKTLQNYPHLFASEHPRPGNLVGYLLHQVHDSKLPARAVLSAVLAGFSEIWFGRVAIAGINLGDVWSHSSLTGDGPGTQLVPFHKLSQWLTYSLLEPLQELGLEIIDLNELTGLPEYRNGGLCLDLGLLEAKHSAVTSDRHPPGSEVIVEWRALTVILLDHITNRIRQRLSLTASELPLAKVLQGGTWTAGRRIAAQLRQGGPPPIQIESDGTVF